MINLLPDRAKRIMSLDRRLRLLSVVLLMLSVVAAALCLFLLPTTILLDAYRSGDGLGGPAQTLVNEKLAETEKELANTKIIIDHLSKPVDAREHSSIVEELDQLAGETVRLDQFVFDDKSKLLLSGVAATRSDLSSFRDRLEGSERFKKVELPLSDLAQDEEPPFTFTLTLK